METPKSHPLADIVKLLESLESKVHARSELKILLDSSELIRFVSLLKQILISVQDQLLYQSVKKKQQQSSSKLPSSHNSENSFDIFPSNSFFPEDIQELISALKNQKL